MSDIIWKHGDWVRVESQEHFDYVTGLMKEQGLSCSERSSEYEADWELNLLEVYKIGGDLEFIVGDQIGGLESPDQEVQCPLPSLPDQSSIKVGDEVCVTTKLLDSDHTGVVRYVDEEVMLLIRKDGVALSFYLEGITISPATAPVLDRLSTWLSKNSPALGMTHVLRRLVEDGLINANKLDELLGKDLQ